MAAALLVATAAAQPLTAQDPSRGDLIPLERAIRVALANSRTLADAEAGLENAGQRVREAWASAMPDISASMQYSRSLLLQEIFLPARFLDPNAPAGDVVPIQVGSDNNWQAVVSASQPLFEYSVFAGVGAAGKYRAWQEEVVRGTTHQVVSAVRQAYFDALLSIEELRLTE
ncbi:MAG: TolC family protein, partial [Gemmatimonadales bacterium]